MAVKHWLIVTVGMAVAGVAAGAAWSWLAPPVHGVVVVTKSGKRVHEYLGNEADHYFDSAVIMSGLLIGLGVISAVLLWHWRRRRGPAMTIGLTVGGLAAAAAAAGTGTGLARLRYGHIDIETIPGDHKFHYITEAPAVFFGQTPLQVLTMLLLPAAAATLTYAMMAAASAYDDLGVESSVPKTVASVD
jgi:hypothetical protein